jgi:hypothetical protein
MFMRRLQPAFKSFLDFIVFGNIWIALGALSQLLLTSYLFHIPFNPYISSIVFIATFCVYGFSVLNFRWKGIRSDGSLRQNFIAKYYKVLKIWVGIGCFVVLILSTHLHTLTQGILLLEGLIAYFYSRPIFIWRGRGYSLRSIPTLKIWIISLLWTISCVGLPLIESIDRVSFKRWEVFTQGMTVFCLLFSNCLLFDIRDYSSDLKRNMISIPGLIGISLSKILVFLLMVGITLLNLREFGINSLPFKLYFLTMIAFSPFLLLTQPKKSDYFFMILIDGLLIFPYLIIVLFKDFI